MQIFQDAKIYQTKGIANVILEAPTFINEILGAILKFMDKDWGETPEEDKDLNDAALEYKGRILASYKTSKGTIWINAESEDGEDYTQILVMFPDEY